MSTQFYTIRYTDPIKTPFTVAPSTTNGPANPNTSGFGSGAISANTTLALLGRGSFDYGQPIQQDLVYMLENFANTTAPTYPIEGQLWFKNDTNVLNVYSGSAWLPLAALGGGNIDLATYQIINLGDPVNPTDALNLQTADATYMPLAGGTFTGNVTVAGGNHLTLNAAPSVGTDATNKTYVDNAIAASITGQAGQFVDVGGDTMTGPLTIASSGALNVAGAVSFSANLAVGGSSVFSGAVNVQNALLQITGTGSFDANGLPVLNVPTPTLGSDAANKAYVDSVAGGGGGGSSGTTLTGGEVDTATGTVTLHFASSPDITLDDPVAPFVHTQPTTTITAVADPSYFDSYIREQLIGTGAYTTATLADILAPLDQAAYLATRYRSRNLFEGDGDTTTFAFPEDPYIVGSHRLEVYMDGIKQVASARARGRVAFIDTTDLSTDSGLAQTTPYAFNINVDGTDYDDVTITTPTLAEVTDPVPMYMVIALLIAEIAVLTIPVTVKFFGGDIVFTTNDAGSGTSVTITAPTTGDDLFATMPVLSITNSTVTTDYAYREVGTPYGESATISFRAAPGVGSLIEIIGVKS